MKSTAWLAVLAIFVANALGGISYLWQKLALMGLPPGTVVFLRNTVALVLMAGWLAARGQLRWGYDRGELVRLFLLGNLAYALPLMLGMVGLEHSTASNGSILILLEPASILFFSWLLLREHIRVMQIVGIFVGLAGALVLVLDGASLGALGGLVESEYLRGNLILALHGVLWGIYSPLMRPLAERHQRPVSLTFVAMLLANVTLLPWALTESSQWQAGPHLRSALLWTLWLGLLVSFASTVLWTLSLTKLRSSTIAPFVFVQPLTGVLAGHLVLGEVLTEAALLGAVLIAVSVLLVILRFGARGEAR